MMKYKTELCKDDLGPISHVCPQGFNNTKPVHYIKVLITWSNRKLVTMSVERCHNYVAEFVVLCVVTQHLV
jgi:hypothetical protein